MIYPYVLLIPLDVLIAATAQTLYKEIVQTFLYFVALAKQTILAMPGIALALVMETDVQPIVKCMINILLVIAMVIVLV
jgi:hypothetical protein